MNLRSIHSAMTWKLVSATTALGSSLAMLTGRRNAWPDGRLHELFPHVVDLAMRGNDAAPGSLVSDVDLEKRVRPDHPLPMIRGLVNSALADLFSACVSASGSRKPSAGPRRWLACARRAIAGCPSWTGSSPWRWQLTTWFACRNRWTCRDDASIPCRAYRQGRKSTETGWGTWIRTKAARVRAGSSTAKLSPNGRGS